MSDMLTQEQIEAMMGGASSDGGAAPPDDHDEGSMSQGDMDNMLTSDEKDILGEVGNICMGTSATTMYTLLGHRVSITTPNVHVYTREAILSAYKRPYVAVDVKYVEGVFGSNLLMLREEDAMKITDILMGGEGVVDPDAEFGELQLSAMSEVMNQMVGSSAISLANLLHQTINIDPPVAITVDFGTDELPANILEEDTLYVKIDFDMEIEGVLESKLMQIMTIAFAKDLVTKIVSMEETGELTAASDGDSSAQPMNAPTQPDVPAPAPAPAPQQQAAPPPPQPQMPPPSTMQQASPVDVQAAQFQPFDAQQPIYTEGYENINRIIDVPLQVSVELGKTKKTIREILDLSSGSIVVLEKLAGEHVEIFVNGKLVARGEVVVIEENYGVRITEIVNLPMPTY